jgi:hypothetical protein
MPKQKANLFSGVSPLLEKITTNLGKETEPV